MTIGFTDLRLQRYPLQLPHEVYATILLDYPNRKTAVQAQRNMHSIPGKEKHAWMRLLAQFLSDWRENNHRRQNKCDNPDG